MGFFGLGRQTIRNLLRARARRASPPRALGVSLSTPTLSLAPGVAGSALMVSVTRVGLTEPVTLDVAPLPSGVTATWTTNPLGADEVSTLLTLAAEPDAGAVTNLALQVTATELGGAAASVTLRLTVQPAASLAVDVIDDDGQISVDAGLSVEFQVRVARVNVAATPVVAVSSVPAPATATVDPVPVVDGDLLVYTGVIAAPSDMTSIANDVVVVRATAPGVPDAQTTFSLTVNGTAPTGLPIVFDSRITNRYFDTYLTPTTEDDVTFRVARPTTGFAGDITVTPLGVPAGFEWQPTVIPAGQTSATMHIKPGAGVAFGTWTLEAAFSGVGTETKKLTFVLTHMPDPEPDAAVVVGPGNLHAAFAERPTWLTSFPRTVATTRRVSESTGSTAFDRFKDAALWAASQDADTTIVVDELFLRGTWRIPVRAYPARFTEVICEAEYNGTFVPFGQRITRGDLVVMPVFESGSAGEGFMKTPDWVDNDLAANQANAAASNWRFVGLQIKPNSTTAPTTQQARLIVLGPMNATEPLRDPSGFPSHHIFERCYIGTEWEFFLNTCITHASKALVVRDSIVIGATPAIGDTPVIGGSGCIGPVLVENNEIAGTGELLYWGGSGQRLPVPPGDITIEHNWCYKPLQFNPSVERDPEWPAYNNVPRESKAMLESKNGKRWTVRYNIFENSWKGTWVGTGVVFKSVAEHESGELGEPYTSYDTSDITFAYNFVRNCLNPFTIVECEKESTAPYARYSARPTRRIDVYGNLFEIGNPLYLHYTALTGSSDARQAFNSGASGPDALHALRGGWAFRRNTWVMRPLHAGVDDSAGTQFVLPVSEGGTKPMTGVVWEDNILAVHGTRGFSSMDLVNPKHGWEAVQNLGWTMRRNVFVEMSSLLASDCNARDTYFTEQADSQLGLLGLPPHIIRVSGTATASERIAAIGFTDRAGGNYRLRPPGHAGPEDAGSPYHPTNLQAVVPVEESYRGADFDVLDAVESGCLSGTWP